MAKLLMREFGVFDEFTNAELEKVLSLAVEREYDAGTAIFKEGQPAQELLLVEDGKIALQMQLPSSQSSHQRKVTVDFAGRGDVLGWSTAVEPYVLTLSAITLQRVKLKAIDAQKLRSLIESDYQVGYKLLAGLIKVVASRLAETRALLMSERITTSE